MSAADPVPAGPSPFLAAVKRRWWLVLLFVAVGAAAGFLLYATRQPSYRSEAKLRVLKRDTARTATDGRVGYVDDYVNSQQETIQSEYILGEAGVSKAMQQASPAFRERLTDKPAAFDALRGSFAVSRGKDTSAGLGNSVLQLSFTADDPRDARVALDAIIETFRKDLEKTSDQTVVDAIRKTQVEIDDLDRALSNPTDADHPGLQDRKATKTAERFRITSEEPASIATRWASGRDELVQINRQLTDVQSTLELLKTAKKDARDRTRLVEIVTGTRGLPADAAAGSLDGQKRLLDLKIKQLAETLGKDHPDMKQAVAQREYLMGELARLNPDNPTGETDDLALLRAQMERKKASLEEQKNEVAGRVAEHEEHLKQLRPLLADIDQLDFAIGKLNERKTAKQAELARLQSARKSSDELGGVEATVLNQPRDGGKVGPVLLTWLLPLALAGGLLGGGLATVLELRDQRFRTPAEVRQRLGLQVVGHLPAIRANKPAEADTPAGFDPTLVAAVRPRSAEAEAFRGLRTQVLRSAEADDRRVIQVTSPSPADGKSTLAANLAISLAQAGKRVVLIDADFRKPRVHALFGLPGDEPGLAAAVDGTAEVFAVVRPTPVEGLGVVPCGPRPEHPAELLSAPRFRDVLAALRGRYEYVVVDTPPLLAVSDPRVVAQRADAVLLTLRLATTARADGERAAEMLADLGVAVLGVAVNATRPDEAGYGGYRYQYAADGYTDS